MLPGDFFIGDDRLTGRRRIGSLESLCLVGHDVI